MSDITDQKRLDVAIRATAEAALQGLSSKAKVHFALQIILGVDTPSAAGAVAFAAAQITDHSTRLMRTAYEGECA